MKRLVALSPQPEEEYMDGDEVIGLGVLGKGQGSGRLRIVAKEQKMKLTAKTAKKVARQHGGRGGTVSGLTSTLAFTPVQGFEVRIPVCLGVFDDQCISEGFFLIPS